MTVVKRHEVGALIARWPADLRLLLLVGQDDSGIRALAGQALATLSDASDPLSITDIPPDRLKQDPALLADEAAATSMFGGRRVLRVDNAPDHVSAAVELLLTVPAAGNPVVMTAGDLRKTSALWKLAEGSKLARLAICYPMDARDLGRWIGEQANGLGLSLAPGVADRLAAASGGDQGVLARELEKFALYLNAAPDRPQRLEAAHLAALGVDSLEEDMAALIAALISGDDSKLDLQLGLLPPGSAIGLLRVLARRLMQLAEIRAAMDAGKSAPDAVNALRPPVFFKERDMMAAAMRRWPARRIARALDVVLAAEAAIKTPASAGDRLGLQAIAGMAAAAGVGAGQRSA